ncbi:hypothetical protein [Vallitalea maricola]|uniref:Uncharacterized protein n=1 Tax=Vallitalea maricola TaxID=3074433 RepID=A0ACB5URQ6_9FIRM|nr:hypothetical protein AN2V17_46200 [Vallitalea sp. AN17-2]
MKKYFLVTVVILSVLMFQGCSKSNSSKDNEATKAVSSFMDNLVEGNFKEAYDNLETKVEDEFFDEMQTNPMNDLLFGQLKYEVVDSEIKDDTATVKIKVTHPKLDEIVASLMSSVDISNLGDQAGDSVEKGQDMLQKALDEVTKDKEIATEETEAVIELKLVDDKWVISEDCDLTGILGVQ